MPKKKKETKAKIDIKSHVLVPKHSKLSEKDKKTLFETYKISTNDLPVIHITDSAIAGLDVKEGDIIKIERDSPTAGKAIFYRGVVSDE